jgi:hypothetical protein
VRNGVTGNPLANTLEKSSVLKRRKRPPHLAPFQTRLMRDILRADWRQFAPFQTHRDLRCERHAVQRKTRVHPAHLAGPTGALHRTARPRLGIKEKLAWAYAKLNEPLRYAVAFGSRLFSFSWL